MDGIADTEWIRRDDYTYLGSQEKANTKQKNILNEYWKRYVVVAKWID